MIWSPINNAPGTGVEVCLILPTQPALCGRQVSCGVRQSIPSSILAICAAEIDAAPPDAEGRHRINEVYCHDSTWQQALDALVAISDVVLMDLRSFKAHNRGCRHELGVLARAPRLARVVVLVDADTALPEARADAAGAPPGRFVWLDAARQPELLAALFVADTAAHG